MTSRRRRAVAGALAIAWATAAPAQTPREVRGSAPGEFDFYVLALSWSPGFCEIEGDRRERDQCAPGSGLGFVVHGLWPQYARGYPVQCGAERFVPQAAMDEARGLFPSPGLARHQWRRHGTCSGKSPADYFRDTRGARDRLRIPERFETISDDQRLAVPDLERAFAAANPGLRPDMISVACRRGALHEVRICFTRDLRAFTSCPELDRSGCRGEILVKAIR